MRRQSDAVLLLSLAAVMLAPARAWMSLFETVEVQGTHWRVSRDYLTGDGSELEAGQQREIDAWKKRVTPVLTRYAQGLERLIPILKNEEPAFPLVAFQASYPTVREETQDETSVPRFERNTPGRPCNYEMLVRGTAITVSLQSLPSRDVRDRLKARVSRVLEEADKPPRR